MQALATFLLVLTCCGVLGCEADRVELSPDPEQFDEVSLGEQQQASCVDCECPRGQRCMGGACQWFPVFGPIPSPPLSPACVCDRQCSEGWTLPAEPGRGPARCHMNGSYGYCSNPLCSISWSDSTVPPNGTATFSVSSDLMPAGSYSRLYGTRDNIPDENGARFDLTSGNFPILNSPGMAGTYMRYVRMFGPDDQQLCETAQISIVFQ